MAVSSFLDRYILQYLQERDRQSFGGKDKILFFKELSYMLKWWVSLVEAMEVLSSNTDNFAIQDIAKKIKKLLHGGKSFSLAIRSFPDLFDTWDCNIIKSGEQTGNLHIVLEELSQEYEYINDIQSRYTSALMYPLVLVAVALIAVISLFWFVLPWIFDIATGFANIEIPMATRILKWISDFLIGNWKTLLACLLVIVLLSFVYFSWTSGKRQLFKLLLQVPLLGQMTKQYYLVKWCRYTKLMFASGLNYVETFSLLRDILGIPAYHSFIEEILSGVKKWQTIYHSIPKPNTLLPNNVAVLIKVGEETANLKQAFENILAMYQKELDLRISRLSKVIEPVMLIVIGIIIVFVAMGVFGLILEIMNGTWT